MTLSRNKGNSDEVQRTGLKRDSQLRTIMNSTPQQINQYVNNNVTSLPAVRKEIKRIYKMLALLYQDR